MIPVIYFETNLYLKWSVCVCTECGNRMWWYSNWCFSELSQIKKKIV